MAATMSKQQFFSVRVLALATVAQCKADIYTLLRKQREGLKITKMERLNAVQAVCWLRQEEAIQLMFELEEGIPHVAAEWVHDAERESGITLTSIDESQLSFNL